jgi:hypothetical protein
MVHLAKEFSAAGFFPPPFVLNMCLGVSSTCAWACALLRARAHAYHLDRRWP